MAFFVDDIVLFPFKMVKWVAENLHESAESEITDDSRVAEQLLELQMRYELDEIGDEEYAQGETKLMAELEAIRKYKESHETKGSN